MASNSLGKLRRSIQPRRPFCEPLEHRVFLHSGPLQVSSVSADDRGEATIILNQAARAADVNRSSVQLLTAGADGILSNADDVKQPISLAYQVSTNRIIVRANLPAGTVYRVKLVSARIASADGHAQLDGDFTGAFPSGNGIAGGNFEFQTRNDSSNRPLSRWSTSAGTFNVRFFRDAATLTFNNFRNYMNKGNYDNIFFTRLLANTQVQAGTLRVDPAKNTVESVPVRNPVVNEFGLPNRLGTLAMLVPDGNPNGATNEFLFNLSDTRPPDTDNNGNAVFGEVVGSSGLSVLAGIGNKAVQNLTVEIGGFPNTDLTSVPVNLTVDGPLNPSRDLVIIRRVSMLMKVGALVRT